MRHAARDAQLLMSNHATSAAQTDHGGAKMPTRHPYSFVGLLMLWPYRSGKHAITKRGNMTEPMALVPPRPHDHASVHVRPDKVTPGGSKKVRILRKVSTVFLDIFFYLVRIRSAMRRPPRDERADRAGRITHGGVME